MLASEPELVPKHRTRIRIAAALVHVCESFHGCDLHVPCEHVPTPFDPEFDLGCLSFGRMPLYLGIAQKVGGP